MNILIKLMSIMALVIAPHIRVADGHHNGGHSSNVPVEYAIPSESVSASLSNSSKITIVNPAGESRGVAVITDGGISTNSGNVEGLKMKFENNKVFGKLFSHLDQSTIEPVFYAENHQMLDGSTRFSEGRLTVGNGEEVPARMEYQIRGKDRIEGSLVIDVE